MIHVKCGIEEVPLLVFFFVLSYVYVQLCNGYFHIDNIHSMQLCNYFSIKIKI